MDPDQSLCWSFPQPSLRCQGATFTNNNVIDESFLLDAEPIFHGQPTEEVIRSMRAASIGGGGAEIVTAYDGDETWGGTVADGPGPRLGPGPINSKSIQDSIDMPHSQSKSFSTNLPPPRPVIPQELPHQPFPRRSLLLGRDRQRSTSMRLQAVVGEAKDMDHHTRSERTWNVPGLSKVQEGRIEKRRVFDLSIAPPARSLQIAAVTSGPPRKSQIIYENTCSISFRSENRSRSRLMGPPDALFDFGFEPRVFGETSEKKGSRGSKREKSQKHDLKCLAKREGSRDAETVDEHGLGPRQATDGIDAELTIGIEISSTAPATLDEVQESQETAHGKTGSDAQSSHKSKHSDSVVKREVLIKSTVQSPGSKEIAPTKEPTKARSFFAALKSKAVTQEVPVEKPVNDLDQPNEQPFDKPKSVSTENPQEELAKTRGAPAQILPSSVEDRVQSLDLVELPDLPSEQSDSDSEQSHDTRPNADHPQTTIQIAGDGLQEPVEKEDGRSAAIDETTAENTPLAGQSKDIPFEGEGGRDVECDSTLVEALKFGQPPTAKAAYNAGLCAEGAPYRPSPAVDNQAVDVTFNHSKSTQPSVQAVCGHVYNHRPYKPAIKTKALTVPIAPSFGRPTKSTVASTATNQGNVKNPQIPRHNPVKYVSRSAHLSQPSETDVRSIAPSRAPLVPAHAQRDFNQALSGHSKGSAASQSSNPSNPSTNDVFGAGTSAQYLQTSLYNRLTSSSSMKFEPPLGRKKSSVVKVPDYAAAHRAAETKRRQALQQGQSRLTKVEGGRTPGRTSRMRMQERAQHGQIGKEYHQRRQEAREKFLQEKEVREPAAKQVVQRPIWRQSLTSS